MQKSVLVPVSHPFLSDNRPLDSSLDWKNTLAVLDWIPVCFSFRFLFEMCFSQKQFIHKFCTHCTGPLSPVFLLVCIVLHFLHGSVWKRERKSPVSPDLKSSWSNSEHYWNGKCSMPRAEEATLDVEREAELPLLRYRVNLCKTRWPRNRHEQDQAGAKTSHSWPQASQKSS